MKATYIPLVIKTYSEGHFGLSLILSSLIAIPMFYFHAISIDEIPAFCFMVAAFSFLPDIDLYRLKGIVKHRGPTTHSLMFAIIVALGVFGFLLYSKESLYICFLGLTAGFLAMIFHFVGDYMTFEKFPMMFPFSRDLYGGEDWFKSGQEPHGLFVAGFFVFILVYFYLSGGFSGITPKFLIGLFPTLTSNRKFLSVDSFDLHYASSQGG